MVRYNVSIAEDGKEGRVFNEIRNDSFYFEFYERNCDTAYKISINAETRAGYNETLDLNEILIPLQYEGLNFSCKYFSSSSSPFILKTSISSTLS